LPLRLTTLFIAVTHPRKILCEGRHAVVESYPISKAMDKAVFRHGLRLFLAKFSIHI